MTARTSVHAEAYDCAVLQVATGPGLERVYGHLPPLLGRCRGWVVQWSRQGALAHGLLPRRRGMARYLAAGFN